MSLFAINSPRSLGRTPAIYIYIYIYIMCTIRCHYVHIQCTVYIMHTRHNISMAMWCTIYTRIHDVVLYDYTILYYTTGTHIYNIVCMCVAYARVGGQEETRYLKWRHTTRRLLYIYNNRGTYVRRSTHDRKHRHTIASSRGACVCVIIIIVMWNGTWTRVIIFQGSTL